MPNIRNRNQRPVTPSPSMPRAKEILILGGFTESDAHQFIRKAAMDNGLTKETISLEIIADYERFLSDANS